MSWPECSIIVDEGTRKMLGRWSREYGVTYGKIVEMLVKGEIDVPGAVDEH